MSDALREAILRALAEDGGSDAGSGGEVARAVLDVEVGGRTEMVTVALRQGRLVCVSSDGSSDGPHVRAALAWLVGGGTAPPGAVPGGGLTMRARPIEHVAVEATSGRWEAIADAVDDVITAVVRLGVERALGSPSVDEAQERLAEIVGEPPPLGVARWVGRLRHALATLDVELTARQLDEGARLVAHLREGPVSREGRTRLLGWLGVGAPGAALREAVTERVLVEVGREWVAGFGRGQIQRRYLVDLAGGELFREERLRGEPASLGGCPRQVQLAFGEVEPGSAPRRMRVLQYAVTLEVGREAWERVEQQGRRDFAALAEEYRREVQGFPGLSEPFAVVVPERYAHEAGGLLPLDANGQPLPIARSHDSGAAAVLDQLGEKDDPLFLAGRLVDADGGMMLLPFAAAMPSPDGPRVHRLR